MIAIITFAHRCSGSVISVDETYAYPFCETLLRLVLSEYKDISNIRLVTREEWEHGTDDISADDLTSKMRLVTRGLGRDNVEYRDINDEYYTYPGQRRKLRDILKMEFLRREMPITNTDLDRMTDSLLKEV